MKKTILSTVLLSSLFLSVGATNSFADKPKDKDEATSRVEVKLTDDEGHEDNEGPYATRLAIVKKPTTYKFIGSASTNQFELINKNGKSENMFMAIHDDRREGNSGDSTKDFAPSPWKLEGQLSDITSLGNEQLAGAVFQIGVNENEVYEFNVEGEEKPNSDTDIQFPTLPEVAPTPITNPSVDYQFEKPISIVAGEQTAAPIMTRHNVTADSSRGMYTNFGNAKLIIPKNQGGKAADYSGTITWTLSAQ